jgi:nondiscriminating aspartyl-tRNA synthetase
MPAKKTERTYTRDISPHRDVLLKGWVSQVRDLGGLKFLMLRDREGSVQVTIKKRESPPKLLKAADSLNREDCIAIHGKPKKAKQAPGGFEIIPRSIEIISKADTPLPIDIDSKIETGMDKRYDFRFMDIRNPRIQAIFRIRDRVMARMREYFENQGFVEINTPVIQAAGAEGGSTLFPIVYYQKEAFLRQSPQLYKQMIMASGLDRVYEIGPVFRAEKFHTRRHLSEYVSVDFEMAWIESEEDVMKVLEEMVHHTIKGVKKDCRSEFDAIGTVPVVPEIPFRRFTYDDVLNAIARKGTRIEWGEDLDDPSEKLFGEIQQKKGNEWYFITKYPSKIKPFYIMLDGKLSRGIDLDYKGMEMASGGQREHRYDVLRKVMKEKGLDPHKFEFYLNAFRYGQPPHGGIGFGSERLVQQMINAENIKEIVLYPRTPERLVP